MAFRMFRGALGAALIAALAGCSDQVTGSIGCPDLCTDETAQLRDTVLTGTVVLDTTFTGFPRFGTLIAPTLVAQGDTAEVRVVARFDTLPNLYRPAGAPADSAITRVDSATLVFIVDTAYSKPAGTMLLEAFDVDTTAADTLPGALLPLFRPDRLIGSMAYTVNPATDTVRLPISNEVLLAKITATKRLRIGLRLSGGSGAAARRLRLTRIPEPFMRFRVSPDTNVAPLIVSLRSNEPTDFPPIANALRLYPLIAAGAAPPPPSGIIAAGGISGARTLLQFDIPPIVLDSVQVIRATLQLTQMPSRLASAATDTVDLVVNPLIAGPVITDLYTASQFIGSPAGFGIDTLGLVPRDSGRREIEVVNLIRAWRAIGLTNTPRWLVLRAVSEGELPGELNFFGTESPVGLRPSLRLTYVPRRGFGLP